MPEMNTHKASPALAASLEMTTLWWR